jgi:hypothetical protein
VGQLTVGYLTAFVSGPLTGLERHFPECVVLYATWALVLPASAIVSREYA